MKKVQESEHAEAWLNVWNVFFIFFGVHFITDTTYNFGHEMFQTTSKHAHIYAGTINFFFGICAYIVLYHTLRHKSIKYYYIVPFITGIVSVIVTLITLAIP